jgi:hypothetical protein
MFNYKLSEWWEIMVAFTIVRNSHYGISLEKMLGMSRQFSADRKIRNKTDQRKLGFLKEKSLNNENVIKNTVILPFKKENQQEGFDTKIILANEVEDYDEDDDYEDDDEDDINILTKENNRDDEDINIYTKTEIKLTKKKTLSKIIMNTIFYSLLDHHLQPVESSIENVLIVFYIWDDFEFGFERDHSQNFSFKVVEDDRDFKRSFFKKMIEDELDAVFQRNIENIPSSFTKKIIEEFTDKYWVNIQVLNKRKLKEFLISSFLPFPILFSSIYADEEEN